MPLNHPELLASDPGHRDALMIEALRQVSGNLEKIGNKLDTVENEVHQARVNVAVLQERDGRIVKLEEAVMAIQVSEHKRSGALQLTNWLSSNWQFLAIAGAALAYAKGVI